MNHSATVNQTYYELLGSQYYHDVSQIVQRYLDNFFQFPDGFGVQYLYRSDGDRVTVVYLVSWGLIGTRVQEYVFDAELLLNDLKREDQFRSVEIAGNIAQSMERTATQEFLRGIA